MSVAFTAGCSGTSEDASKETATTSRAQPTGQFLRLQAQGYLSVRRQIEQCLASAGFPRAGVVLHLVTERVSLDIPAIVRKSDQALVQSCVAEGSRRLVEIPLPEGVVDKVLKEAAVCSGDSVSESRSLSGDDLRERWAVDPEFSECVGRLEDQLMPSKR